MVGDGREESNDELRWAMSLQTYVKQAVADIETKILKAD
jgi:hypothetical protein